MEPAPHRKVGQRQKVDHRWRALKKQKSRRCEASSTLFKKPCEISDFRNHPLKKQKYINKINTIKNIPKENTFVTDKIFATLFF